MVQSFFIRNSGCLHTHYNKVRYQQTFIIKHDQELSILTTQQRCKTDQCYMLSLEVCYVGFLTVSSVRILFIKRDFLEVWASELSLWVLIGPSGAIGLTRTRWSKIFALEKDCSNPLLNKSKTTQNLGNGKSSNACALGWRKLWTASFLQCFALYSIHAELGDLPPRQITESRKKADAKVKPSWNPC